MGNVRSKLCEYQRAYFYFDGRHNTEKAQEEFAHLFFGADTNVVQPMTLRELIVFPFNEPMREYWKPSITTNPTWKQLVYILQTMSDIYPLGTKLNDTQCPKMLYTETNWICKKNFKDQFIHKKKNKGRSMFLFKVPIRTPEILNTTIQTQPWR